MKTFHRGRRGRLVTPSLRPLQIMTNHGGGQRAASKQKLKIKIVSELFLEVTESDLSLLRTLGVSLNRLILSGLKGYEKCLKRDDFHCLGPICVGGFHRGEDRIVEIPLRNKAKLNLAAFCSGQPERSRG